jgi:hypothetical protein
VGGGITAAGESGHDFALNRSFERLDSARPNVNVRKEVGEKVGDHPNASITRYMAG